MNYENELSKLKTDLDKAKNLKYQAKARLEQLSKQEENIIEELKKLDVKPENLKEEIEKLDENIKNLFKEANEYIPTDLLDKK